MDKVEVIQQSVDWLETWHPRNLLILMFWLSACGVGHVVSQLYRGEEINSPPCWSMIWTSFLPTVGAIGLMGMVLVNRDWFFIESIQINTSHYFGMTIFHGSIAVLGTGIVLLVIRAVSPFMLKVLKALWTASVIVFGDYEQPPYRKPVNLQEDHKEKVFLRDGFRPVVKGGNGNGAQRRKRKKKGGYNNNNGNRGQ